MELKPGYKQTEVGVIPEDWEVKHLGEIGECIIGLTYRPEDVSTAGTLVLRSSNIQGESLLLEDTVYVSSDIPDRIRVRIDDVLICVRNGSRSLIGKCLLLDERTKDETFGAFMSVFRSSNGPFVYWCFQTNHLKGQIGQHLGATINQITNRTLNSLVIPYPSLPEQKAIAKALSDVDSLLSGLDSLIAKKRDIKQATMQQLLTGKTRLPGFSGEWEVKRLGEVAEIRSGGTPTTSDNRCWNGDIAWCTPTDITALQGKTNIKTTARTITHLGLRSSSAELIPMSSVIMTSRATIGECAINSVPLATNQGFKNFVPGAETNVHFLYYLLTSQKEGFLALCSGSTFLELSKGTVANYEVCFPPLPEQQAIATVLTDMDAELEALEQRRDKTRELKQAMMQELLTGRIRLV